MADEKQAPSTEHDLEATVRAMATRMDEMARELDLLRGGRAPDALSSIDEAERWRRSTPNSSVAKPSQYEEPPSEGRISRRGALVLGAAAAVGLGAVADSVLSATPAGATTGNMQYGVSNNANTAATDLTSTATSQTLSIENTGTGAALYLQGLNGSCITADQEGDAYVLFARTNGSGAGICMITNSFTNINPTIEAVQEGLGNPLYCEILNTGSSASAIVGTTNGAGVGVEGRSTSGYGAEFNGGLAPILLIPGASAGPPTSGTHAVGEVYVDSVGVVWTCQVAGTPGVWVPALVGGATNVTAPTTLSVPPGSDLVTLTVENTGTGPSGAALVGSDGGTGTVGGVRGELDNVANDSPAVEGITNGTGPALAGACHGAGYGAALEGGLAPLWLQPAGTPGPPTSGAHQLGELYFDVNGVQYRCVAAGTPGTWVPQYSVVPLMAPVRVINSSTGEGGITGPLVPGVTVHTSSVLTGLNGIPAGAIGVVANLAVSGVGGASLNGYGVMTIFPAGAATPGTANINAGAGSFAESNAVTVAFGTGAEAGKVSIVWNGGGPVPNAQAYLDVNAYIL